MIQQQKGNAHYRKLIDKWQGGDACLWEYGVSHSRLAIRITSKERSGNLHIVCLDTEFISGPVKWHSFSLEIREINYKNADGAEINFALRDEKANFEVHCGLFGAEENVEPLY